MTRKIAALVLVAFLALITGGCSASNGPTQPPASAEAPTPTPTPTQPAYTTVGQIVDALRAAGLDVSDPTRVKGSYVEEDLGGQSWDTNIGARVFHEDKIAIFPNPEALDASTERELAYGGGGVVVTGGRWAIWLDKQGAEDRQYSERLAPRVAAALGGEVQQ